MAKLAVTTLIVVTILLVAVSIIPQQVNGQSAANAGKRNSYCADRKGKPIRGSTCIQNNTGCEEPVSTGPKSGKCESGFTCCATKSPRCKTGPGVPIDRTACLPASIGCGPHALADGPFSDGNCLLSGLKCCRQK